MAGERRRLLILGTLVLVLLALVLYRAWTLTSTGPAAASNPNGSRDAASLAPKGESQGLAAPDVHLQVLNSEHPKPVPAGRNLFRFKPKAPPAPPPGQARTSPGVVPDNPVVSGPPPLPPINLKFIGLIEQAGGKPKIAVLTDGIGPPLYGEEGKSIAGRYKILRIGAESIEMSYLDGRGRQTIRLTGGS